MRGAVSPVYPGLRSIWRGSPNPREQAQADFRLGQKHRQFRPSQFLIPSILSTALRLARLVQNPK